MNLQQISRDMFIALLEEPDLLMSTKAVNHLWVKPEPTVLTDDVLRPSEKQRLIDHLAPFYMVDKVLASGWVNFTSSDHDSLNANLFGNFIQQRLINDERYALRSLSQAPCCYFVDRSALIEHSFKAYLKGSGGIELKGYVFTDTAMSDIITQLQHASQVEWVEIEIWDSALREDRIYRCFSNPSSNTIEQIPTIFKAQYPSWMTLTKITGHSLEAKSTESLLWTTSEDTPLKGVTYGLS